MKKLLIYTGLTALLIYSVFSCKKEEKTLPPKVLTSSVDNILNTSARVGGKVSEDGGSEITERGYYWDTITNPETKGLKVQMGTGVGVFYDTLKGLKSGKKYFVKAFAKNNVGTAYGEKTFFTTQIHLPTVTTSQVTQRTSSSATVGGTVIDDGGFEVTARGVYWGVHPNPAITGIKVEIDKGKGAFSTNLTELARTSEYYYVAFATNIKGTSYGDEINFRTEPVAPILKTIPAKDITTHTALVGGEITSNGGATVTERGIYWGANPNTITTGTKLVIGPDGTFASTLSNLTPGSTYYYTVYAVNSIGTSYGTEMKFTLLGKNPSAKTLAVTNLSRETAILNGVVSANSLNTTVRFEYGLTTAYGSVINYNTPVTQDNDTIRVNITGLTSNTIYHYRIIAENELGTVYGRDTSFRTVLTGKTGTVTDRDGNTYNTLGIGYQEWTTTNLRTTKYSDGTPIPRVMADTSWAKLITPAYCWYNKDSANHATPYGALYNWYVVETGKLCPTGWKVPSKEDFEKLINFIGDASIAGKILKETGSTHWNTSGLNGSDDYGFKALPGGSRLDDGSFDYKGVEGNFWNSNNYSTRTASYLQLLYNYNMALQGYIYKKYGLSVRCIKE